MMAPVELSLMTSEQVRYSLLRTDYLHQAEVMVPADLSVMASIEVWHCILRTEVEMMAPVELSLMTSEQVRYSRNQSN